MKKIILAAFIMLGGFLLMFNPAEAKKMDRLTPKEQSIIKISSYTAQGNLPELEKTLNSGLDNGLSINEIKEILVQLYAYCGFPRSLNAINTFIKVTSSRNGDTIGETPETMPEDINKFEVGKRNTEKIFGKSDAKAPYEEFAPAINTFLKEHLFCDIFERGVLSYKEREIATVSALASIEGLEPQLTAHLNGAMNIGLTEDEAKELYETVKTCLPKEQSKAAEKVFKNVIEHRK